MTPQAGQRTGEEPRRIMSSSNIVNVVIAGLGGQGILRASDILADAAFRAGRSVKKAEVHGMSQRGGSVHSDVRFAPESGGKVLSPMVPAGEADFLVVLDETQVETNRSALASDGQLLTIGLLDGVELPHSRSANVAMLGCLSTRLDLDETSFREAIESHFPADLREANLRAFEVGRSAG
jgi:indolepyruvate ferredoxin oxidoreductase beta subunit